MMRPLAVADGRPTTPLHLGVEQNVLGEIGFSVDTRVYGARVVELPALGQWPGTAHAADRLRGNGALTSSAQGRAWDAPLGGATRTDAGLRTEAPTLVLLDPGTPTGLVRLRLDGTSGPSPALVWRADPHGDHLRIEITPGTLRLVRRRAGQDQEVAHGELPGAPGALEVTDDDATVRVRADGNEILVASTDPGCPRRDRGRAPARGRGRVRGVRLRGPPERDPDPGGAAPRGRAVAGGRARAGRRRLRRRARRPRGKTGRNRTLDPPHRARALRARRRGPRRRRSAGPDCLHGAVAPSRLRRRHRSHRPASVRQAAVARRSDLPAGPRQLRDREPLVQRPSRRRRLGVVVLPHRRSRRGVRRGVGQRRRPRAVGPRRRRARRFDGDRYHVSLDGEPVLWRSGPRRLPARGRWRCARWAWWRTGSGASTPEAACCASPRPPIAQSGVATTCNTVDGLPAYDGASVRTE